MASAPQPALRDTGRPDRPRQSERLNPHVEGTEGHPLAVLPVAVLPDILVDGLDVVFVGFNPSLPAARTGHYYAGPRNHFYRLLFQYGFTPAFLTYEHDCELPRYGVGLTDLCPVPSAMAAQLPRGALEAGRETLRIKLEAFAPRVVCFNGLGAYRAFFGEKAVPGLSGHTIDASQVFVVPSSSPANNGMGLVRDKAWADLARYLGRVAPRLCGS